MWLSFAMVGVRNSKGVLYNARRQFRRRRLGGRLWIWNWSGEHWKGLEACLPPNHQNQMSLNLKFINAKLSITYLSHLINYDKKVPNLFYLSPIPEICYYSCKIISDICRPRWNPTACINQINNLVYHIDFFNVNTPFASFRSLGFEKMKAGRKRVQQAHRLAGHVSGLNMQRGDGEFSM